MVMKHLARMFLAVVTTAGVPFLGYLAVSGSCLSSSTVPITANQASVKENLLSKSPNKIETSKVDQALCLLIDTMFGDRQVKQAFERDFRFSSPTPEEMGVIDETSDMYYSDDFAKSKDVRTAARAFAVGWNYGYQSVFLALGTASLSNEANFKGNLQRAEGEIDQTRKSILNKHGITEDEFYKLEGQVTHGAANDRNLATMELIQAELQCFIDQQIDPITYKNNVMTMENDRIVQKRGTVNHPLYVVAFKPMFKVVFVPQGDVLKMVSFGDLQ